MKIPPTSSDYKKIIHFLYNNISINNAANIVIAFITALILGAPKIWLWFALVVVVALARQISRALFLRFESFATNRFWFVVFLVGVILAAAVWIIGVFYFFQAEQIWQKLYIGFVLPGLCIGALSTHGPALFVYYSYITLMLGGLFLYYISDQAYLSKIMALLVAIYYIFLLVVAKKVSIFFREMIVLGRKREEAKARLINTQQELNHIFENFVSGIFYYDNDLHIVKFNKKFCDILDVPCSKLKNLHIGSIKDRRILPVLQKVIHGEEAFYEGSYHTTLSDKEIFIRMKCIPIEKEGAILGGMCIVEDIGESVRNRKEIEKFAKFYINNPNPVFGIDCKEKRIIIQNRASEHILREWVKQGTLFDEICGAKKHFLQKHLHNKIFSFYFVHLDGGRINVYGTDITQEILAKEKVVFYTNYDDLTKLPQRKLFLEFLEIETYRVEREKIYSALLFIDLDDFKMINDTFGHDVGDKLLVALSQRLKRNLRKSDRIARFGGDEYLVLASNLGRDEERAAEHAYYVANKILSLIKKPFDIDGIAMQCHASIGMTLFHTKKEPFELLKEADAAMYRAKNQGKNTIWLFDQNLKKEIEKKGKIIHALQSAVENGEFVLYYQPKIDLATGRVASAEALIRWDSPYFGFVDPGFFIPLAEEGGLIHDITRWVLAQVNRDFSSLKDLANISINISAKELARFDFIDSIKACIKEHAIDTKRVELEITESIIIEDFKLSENKIVALKDMGFRLSIDDFGTGYSSLAYLKNLSLDLLKIDRSFIQDIGKNRSDEVLTRTIVTIAKEFGMQTVAEGVESEEQLRFLKRLGCDYAQGFFFAPPMPLEEFLSWKERFEHQIASKSI